MNTKSKYYSTKDIPSVSSIVLSTSANDVVGPSLRFLPCATVSSGSLSSGVAVLRRTCGQPEAVNSGNTVKYLSRLVSDSPVIIYRLRCSECAVGVLDGGPKSEQESSKKVRTGQPSIFGSEHGIGVRPDMSESISAEFLTLVTVLTRILGYYNHSSKASFTTAAI